MAGVITDFAAMNTAASHVDNVNAALTTTINQLKGQCEGARPAFQGGAGDQFQILMTRYQESSNKLHQALAEIAVKIRENGKGYDAAEQANQDAILAAGNSGSLDINV